jgi:hypothetical protein
MTSQTQSPCLAEHVDKDSLDLIIELQLADIRNLAEASKGKGRENEIADRDCAAEFYRQDLENLRSQLFDRRLTQSIASAVHSDGDLIFQAVHEEEVKSGGRVLAHRSNGTKVTSPTDLPPKFLDGEVLAGLAGLYVSESIGKELCARQDLCDDDGDGGAESSTSAAKRKRSGSRKLNLQCEACQDSKKYFDVIATPCQHNYCRDCLRDLFRASLTDESLFPPRCCRLPIPISSVDIFLTKKLKQAFEEKEIEFKTPNRTYCSDPQCSAFISPGNIEADIGICAHCGISTCVMCKSTAHGGDCPADDSLQGLLNLAQEHGWQRCSSCRRVVELDHGCNHIRSVIVI